MLREKDMKAIRDLAMQDTNLSPDNPDGLADDKGSKKNRIYRRIMAIINRHGSTSLKLYEANDAPLIRNNIFANRELLEDAQRHYTAHRHKLLEANMLKGTKKGRRHARLFFIGNLYGIVKQQEDANAHGTHDFEEYEQGGAEQAYQDLDYINAVKTGGRYPNPLQLVWYNWDKFYDSYNAGKKHAKEFDTVQGKQAIKKRIHKLDKVAFSNLY